MSEYHKEEDVAHVTLDNGKVNALGTASITELGTHLDRSLHDEAKAVVLSGRDGFFSAGFDLAEVRSGDAARESLRRQLIDLSLRIFTFERPVVIACTGHALAAGAALLLTADWRIGIDGPYKLGFNEVTLGVSISAATVALARYRMPMPWFESIVSGETFAPPAAQSAGLLDQLVADKAELTEQAQVAAERLGQVPIQAFLEMRRLARGSTADLVAQERRRLDSPE